MRQRIAVRAIVRKNEQTLLLRRANGRDSILGKFELPGGRIEYGEQPEDSLRRYLRKEAGLEPASLQLLDVVTYIDSDDVSLQYVFIVYSVTVEESSVSLSGNYDKAVWQSKSKIQHRDITESSQVLLGMSEQKILTDEDGRSRVVNDDKNTTESSIVLYSDGGSRGNPGPSAGAFVLETPSNEVVEKGGRYLGIATSQQAEYNGLLAGLERALELGYRRVDCRMDSAMVVNQMRGVYRVKEDTLMPIHRRVELLVGLFESVSFLHINREQNALADTEVNRILDVHEPISVK